MPKQWMNEQDALQFLDRQDIGRLATTDADGQPYITPLHYVLLDGAVYFHCAKAGKKLDNIAYNERICLEVSHPGKSVFSEQACNCATRFESVLLFGRAAVVADTDEKIRALNALTAKHAAGRPFTAVNVERAESCTVVRISIDVISGKRNVDPVPGN